jgi:hypothetical protein
VAAEKKFPLSLIVKAVDQATPTLAIMSAKLKSQLGPFNEFSDQWSKFGKAAHFDAFSKVGSAAKNVGDEVFGLAARLGGLALGAGLAFGAVIKGAMDAGDALGEHANRVGLSVDAYASLQHASAQADVDQEQFASGLDKLNKQLGDMKVGKGGEFLKFLNEISPTFAKQVKGAHGTEEALALLTDAFAKIDDPSKRATLSAHAFGKTNLQMGEWLHTGSAAIQAQQVAFMRLAGSQEEFAKGAGDLDNATRETTLAFTGLRNAAAAGLFPALTKLSNIATKFLAEHREGISAWATKTGSAIDSWVQGGGLQRLADSFGKVADGAMAVGNFLGPMGIAAVAAGIALTPLLISIGSLGVAVVGAIPALIALGGVLLPLAPAILAIAGAGSALAVVGYEIYTSWDSLTKKLEEFGDTLRWAVVDGWAEVRPFLAALSRVPGIGIALAAGDFAANQTSKAIESHTGQSVESIRARNAEAARPQNRSVTTQNNVSIDINGLPPGSRVSQAGEAPVDLSLGYSSGAL